MGCGGSSPSYRSPAVEQSRLTGSTRLMTRSPSRDKPSDEGEAARDGVIGSFVRDVDLRHPAEEPGAVRVEGDLRRVQRPSLVDAYTDAE